MRTKCAKIATQIVQIYMGSILPVGCTQQLRSMNYQIKRARTASENVGYLSHQLDGPFATRVCCLAPPSNHQPAIWTPPNNHED